MSLIYLINEYWYFLLLIIFAAIAVGFFAGLFGIGGGLISVPCLFFIFETLNFDKNYLMHLTVGTAFTITIFTSTVSVMTHHKNRLVDLSVVKTFGIFVVIGVLLGTFFCICYENQDASSILFNSSICIRGLFDVGSGKN